MPANSSDIATLERWIAQRDPKAFGELVARHSGMLFAACQRILGNGAEAEDVVQECFEVLARRQYATQIRLVGPWLHGLAVHRSLQRVRSEGRRKDREARFAAELPVHTDAEWDDIHTYIDEAIGELPDELRAVVIAHFLEGQPHSVIARDVGISRRAVGYRIENGVKRIAHSLNQRGVTIAVPALMAALTTNIARAAPIPPTLSASLGKLTLACTVEQVARDGALTTSTAYIGGFLVMKKGVLVASLVLAGAIMIWLGRVLLIGMDLLDTPIPTIAVEQASVEKTTDTILEALRTGRPLMEVPVDGPATDSGLGTVTGRIYDATTGDAIPGAVIEAKNGVGDGDESTASNTSGAYSLPKLLPGTYTLAHRDVSGYRYSHVSESGRGVTVTVMPGKILEGVDFALEREAPLSGMVVDHLGRPVGGAEVNADDEFGAFRGINTTTLPDGTFNLPGLPPSDGIVLNARKGVAVSQPERIALTGAGRDDVTLVIENCGSIGGWVVNGEGNPVPDVVVSAMPGYRAHGISDSSGAFLIDCLAVGSHTLVMRVNDDGRNINFDTDEQGTEVELGFGEHLEGVILLYDYPYAISGRVTDSAGNGIPGARVNSHLYGVACDEDGYYVMDHLPEGRFNLWTNKKGFKSDEKWWVKAGSENVDWVMKSIVDIEGRVVRSDTGEPVTHFEIVAKSGRWHPSDVGRCGSVHDSEGRFRVESPEEGTLWIYVRAPGFSSTLEEFPIGKRVEAGSITIALTPVGNLEGLVTSLHGAPVEGAAVYCGEAGGAAGNADALTGSDGRFSIASVPADLSEVSVIHPDFAMATVTARAGRTAPLRVVLNGGAVVEGTVSNAEGLDGSVQVYVEYAGRPYIQSHATTLAANGTYRIERLPDGDATVILGGRSGQRAQALATPVLLEQGMVTIVDFNWPVAGGVVEGLVNVNGRATGDVLVQLYVNAEHGEERHVALSGADGLYRFENVSPGPALLYSETASDRGVPVEMSIELEIGTVQVTRQDVNF